MSKNEIKSVLITGAAKRIGRTIALRLAANGWAVGIHYNKSKKEAEQLSDLINNQGGFAQTIYADLLNNNDVGSLIAKAKSKLGSVSCLINNAAIFENDTLLSSKEEIWDRHFQINLRAPFVLIQNFAKEIPASSNRNIINIIDQRVWNLTSGFVSYTLSKSALWSLTQTAALTLAPNIRVNAVGPGPTLPSIHQSQQSFEKQCQSVLLKHGVDPKEIADTIQFILDSPSITGQMIVVDGGEHLGGI